MFDVGGFVLRCVIRAHLAFVLGFFFEIVVCSILTPLALHVDFLYYLINGGELTGDIIRFSTFHLFGWVASLGIIRSDESFVDDQPSISYAVKSSSGMTLQTGKVYLYD